MMDRLEHTPRSALPELSAQLVAAIDDITELQFGANLGRGQAAIIVHPARSCKLPRRSPHVMRPLDRAEPRCMLLGPSRRGTHGPRATHAIP